MRYPTSERVAKWLRHLTRKPKVRTAIGSNPTLDSLVAVRNTSPGQPEPCEGNLVAVAGSCGGLMVKHPWPLLEISLSDFGGLATLNINTYLPTQPDGIPENRPLLSQLHIIHNSSHRNCRLASFLFVFGYLLFFRTCHYIGLPIPPAHCNAIQLMVTIRVSLIVTLYKTLSNDGTN